jgi:ATP-binding cassette subfamily F protein 3
MDEIYSADPKLGEAVIRSICGAMMFSGDNAKKKVSLLSVGEKSRVMLGQILARPTNLLFLDEPTHHLDIDSIEALTKAIESFCGASIIVSHSEELLRRVADRLIIFSKEGAEYFDGGYDLFLEKIGWDEDDIEEVKPKSNSSSKKENKKLRSALIQERSKATTGLKKEVEKLEREIMKLEEKVEEDHKALEEASTSGDNAKIMELSAVIGKDEEAVEEKFEALEESQTKLDEILLDFEEKLEALEN